ncbi:MAG: hypothetical protein ACKOW8_10135, partial [Flavobacteriales bacterium]
VRKMEDNDDVIPCAGSVLTRLVLMLSQIIPEENYRSWGQQILQGVSNEIRYAGSSANWVMAIHEFHRPGRCILIVGPDSHSWKQRLQGTWRETDICLASTNESELPLLKRKSSAHTTAYVCRHGACSLPVTSVEELLHSLEK